MDPARTSRRSSDHHPWSRARVREGGRGPGPAAPARPRLRPHDLDAVIPTGSALHGDRPRPAGPRRERQAARRLLRRRLRQRMRDLLTVLGIDKVTVVGHSFGGGVAMQFAYQFPERTERMILVAPGGLGPEVTPAHPGDHAARLPPRDGRGDAARLRHWAWPGSGRSRAAGAAGPRPRRSPTSSTRSATPVARGDPARRPRRGRHARPDRHDGRPRLPHPGDADVVVWGADDIVIPVSTPRTPRGSPRRGRRGAPERRALPAQGPPRALREDRQHLHPATQPASYHRGRWRSCCATAPPSRPTGPRPARRPSPRSASLLRAGAPRPVDRAAAPRRRRRGRWRRRSPGRGRRGSRRRP